MTEPGKVCSEYWTCLYHLPKVKKGEERQKLSSEDLLWKQYKRMHMPSVWESFMDTKVSACPRWVCVSITQLVYTMRCFIRWFLKIQFGFLFLSKCKILGDLRLPGRKAASFLAVFWQRFADTFMQNLLVFLQHCWVALTNKPSFLLCLLLSRDMQISMEIQREHILISEQRLWLFFLNTFKGFFSGKKVLSLEKSLLLWGAGWPRVIPWPHLWLILSVQQLEPPSARGNSFTPGLENCKHIYLLNMNNVHVLCSLTI